MSAAAQGERWGRAAADWAGYMEFGFRPLYDAALDALGVGAGTRLLDVGCGAGTACWLAGLRGAEVAGLDAAEGMVAVALARTAGDLRVGDMEALPWPTASFDAVTAFNALPYATDPCRPLREARRVLRPGGSLLVATWGRRERCDAARYMAALACLPGVPPEAEARAFALSGEGTLESLLEAAGFLPRGATTVTCVWRYPDLDTLQRGVLAAGEYADAVAALGRDAVVEVLAAAVADLSGSSSCGYVLSNEVRLVVAETAG